MPSAMEISQERSRDSRRGLQRMDEILRLVLAPLGLRDLAPGEHVNDDWCDGSPQVPRGSAVPANGDDR